MYVWTPVYVNNERVSRSPHHYFYYNCLVKVRTECVCHLPCFCASRTMHHYLSPANWTSAPEIILSRRPSIQPSVRAPAPAQFYDPLCFSREFWLFLCRQALEKKWRISRYKTNSCCCISLCFLRLLNYYPRARSKSHRFVKRLRAQVQEWILIF
jgi:hypothetical protein